MVILFLCLFSLLKGVHPFEGKYVNRNGKLRKVDMVASIRVGFCYRNDGYWHLKYHLIADITNAMHAVS